MPNSGHDTSQIDHRTFLVICKLNRWQSKADLCLGRLFILNRGLLEVLGGVNSSIVLFSELGRRRGRAVDRLVLLCGLAGGIGSTVRGILLRFEAGDLLLRLLDVLGIR